MPGALNLPPAAGVPVGQGGVFRGEKDAGGELGAQLNPAGMRGMGREYPQSLRKLFFALLAAAANAPLGTAAQNNPKFGEHAPLFGLGPPKGCLGAVRPRPGLVSDIEERAFHHDHSPRGLGGLIAAPPHHLIKSF